jgi:excinuclease UvrABC ATPase subunit
VIAEIQSESTENQCSKYVYLDKLHKITSDLKEDFSERCLKIAQEHKKTVEEISNIKNLFFPNDGLNNVVLHYYIFNSNKEAINFMNALHSKLNEKHDESYIFYVSKRKAAIVPKHQIQFMEKVMEEIESYKCPDCKGSKITKVTVENTDYSSFV